MSNKENQLNLTEFPSLFSSSLCIDDLSIRNELSLLFFNEDEVQIALASSSLLQADGSAKIKVEKKLNLQLRRCTSFEEIFMENHRNVLIESIKQYFSQIRHEIIHKVTGANSKLNNDPAELTQAQIELILLRNDSANPAIRSKLSSRLIDNADEIKIIQEVMNICPKEIEFEALYLIAFIFKECDHIIQHFHRRVVGKELKEKSIKLAKDLITHPCLSYLFEGESTHKVAENFEVLIEKWTITLFLMKVGVFQNELDSKSVEECFRSDLFRKIDFNDLLNQHLIHPTKSKTQSKSK